MRKANKIMMMTVSILLSLVLITGSVISGTLAKYATSTDQSTEARVAKFGVELGVSLDEEFKKVCGDYTITANNGSILISVPNLKIGPDDDFSKALHVSISGRSEVKLKVNMDVNIERSENFLIPAGNCGLIKDTIYFPIGMTLGCKNESDQYVNDYIMVPGNTATDSQYETLLMFDFSNRIFTNLAGEYYKDMSVESVFEPGEEIVFHPAVLDRTVGDFVPVESVYINEFDLGFEWPFESDSTDKNANDKMDTWLVSQETIPSFGYTFIITVEQVS